MPAKALVTRVLTQLDDIDSFFLRDTGVEHQAWWFDFADQFLQVARKQLSTIEDLIQKYGGPEKVRTVG